MAGYARKTASPGQLRSLHELDHGKTTALTVLETHVVHDFRLTMHVLDVAALRAHGTPTLGTEAKAWFVL